jgi:tRNA threonylcarbamoyladenosine biosynthesis protein TsaB
MTVEGVAAAAGKSAVVVACEVKVAEELSRLHPLMVKEPVAAEALPFAVERFAAKEFDDVATLDANYLRRTDAEIFAKPVAKAMR